ncbi:transposase [Mycoplasma sp. M5725]|uniref:Transposase n=1 Tax=Mycoplasma phocimorsus TaxID=3045839 RepID=A0AAJ1PR23_9MOLU|nr:transposase [Mycoplasma phocimorsus]MDJ1645769.1 transposase [Mycoplasma phocimorsus]
MSRHFTKKIEIIFKEHERLGMARAIKVVINISHKLAFIKKRHIIRRIIRIVSYYNKGMQDLLVEDKRGINRRPGNKAREKKKLRIKNTLKEMNSTKVDRLLSILEENVTLTKEQKKLIVREYKGKLSINELARLFNVSKKTLFRWKKLENVVKTKEYDNILINAFASHKKVYKRVRLSQFIAKKHNIYINLRTLGRDMNRLCLKFEIKRKRKERENKDTTAKFENIVNKDYNDNQNRNIYATDVTYIEGTRDSK